MGELVIRIALPDELDRVRAAYIAWGYNVGAESCDRITVAFRDGEPVGVVRRTIEAGTCMLRGLQVAPHAQRQGSGTRLLSTFVVSLQDWECDCIPYEHLLTFYGREGFALHPPDQAPSFLAARLMRYHAKGHRVVLMRRPGSSGGLTGDQRRNG